MYIDLKELNPHNYDTTPTIDQNLSTLLWKLNKIRDMFGKPMVITSGLRSQADQDRINPSAPKSHHLTGEAADISDSEGKLKKWIKSNIDMVAEIGLWMEDFDHTVTWVHMQIVPPKSGSRFFIP